jgi:hypothetical protein
MCILDGLCPNFQCFLPIFNPQRKKKKYKEKISVSSSSQLGTILPHNPYGSIWSPFPSNNIAGGEGRNYLLVDKGLICCLHIEIAFDSPYNK